VCLASVLPWTPTSHGRGRGELSDFGWLSSPPVKRDHRWIGALHAPHEELQATLTVRGCLANRQATRQSRTNMSQTQSLRRR